MLAWSCVKSILVCIVYLCIGFGVKIVFGLSPYVSAIVMDLCALVFAVWVLHFKDKRLLSNFETYTERSNMFWISIAIFVFVWLVGQLSAECIITNFNITVSNSASNLVIDSNVTMRWILLFVSVILAPVVEEYLMRGYVFTTVKQYSNFIVGAIFSSVLFAILHQTLYQFWSTLLFGFFLCGVFQFTHKLKYCIGFHCVYNLMSVLLAGIIIPDFMISVWFVVLMSIICVGVLVFGYFYLYKNGHYKLGDITGKNDIKNVMSSVNK